MSSLTEQVYYLHALENVKVHSMMVGLSGDGAMLVGVPDHDVCIGAWRYQSCKKYMQRLTNLIIFLTY